MRDHHFHQVGAQQVVSVGAKQLEPGEALQRLHLVYLAAEHQRVAGLQYLVRPDGADQAFLALDLHQIQAIQIAQIVVLDALADQRRVGLHVGGKKIGEPVAGAFRLMVRQRLGLPQQHAKGEQRHRYADQAELEHAELKATAAQRERVDHQVGGGADQGGGAAQDRGVGERNQQPRGSNALLA